MPEQGTFICIEGLDGCGKTTQAKLLAKKLTEKGYDALLTAEPTKSKIGTLIKTQYLHADKRASSIVEALLFAADRYEHVEDKIKPALSTGRIVVSDRYVYSSLAYQGATGLNLDWIEKINTHVLRPDLALYIGIDPSQVAQRLKAKKSVMENLETQKRVQKVYERYVKNGELMEIDGNRSIKEVANNILEVVIGFLKKSRC